MPECDPYSLGYCLEQVFVSLSYSCLTLMLHMHVYSLKRFFWISELCHLVVIWEMFSYCSLNIFVIFLSPLLWDYIKFMILLKLCDKSLCQNCNKGWIYLNLIFKSRLLAPAQLKFFDSFVITTCLFKNVFWSWFLFIIIVFLWNGIDLKNATSP